MKREGGIAMGRLGLVAPLVVLLAATAPIRADSDAESIVVMALGFPCVPILWYLMLIAGALEQRAYAAAGVPRLGARLVAAESGIASCVVGSLGFVWLAGRVAEVIVEQPSGGGLRLGRLLWPVAAWSAAMVLSKLVVVAVASCSVGNRTTVLRVAAARTLLFQALLVGLMLALVLVPGRT